jgi:hypothetical protein
MFCLNVDDGISRSGKILKFTDMTHEITGKDRLKYFVQLFRDW